MSLARLTPVPFFCVLVAASTIAAAQERATAVVLSVAPADGGLAPFAAAIARVERGRLDALGAVRVADTPALSLADLQLAVGCIGEGDACLRAIANELTAEILFYATVDRAGDVRIVTIHAFDARDQVPAKSAQRRGTEAVLVEQIEPMLRELLGLPPAPVVEARVDGAPERGPSSHDPTTLVLSLVSFGGALVAGAIGAVLGALELGSADEWARAPTGSVAQIDAALAVRDRAEEQATIANVMFTVAGVALVAAVTFLVLHLTSHGEARGTL